MNRSVSWLSVIVSARRVRSPHFDTQAFPFGTRKMLFARSAFALAAINRALVAVLQNAPPLLLMHVA
jgi:hypothetical protein